MPHTSRVHLRGLSTGIAVSLVALGALAACSAGQQTPSADTTSAPAATATVQVTETVTPNAAQACSADDLSVSIVKEELIPWSLKFTNISDSTCVIEAGYAKVVPVDSSGEEAAPPFSEANEMEQEIGDIDLAPESSAWAVYSYADEAHPGYEKTGTTSLDVFLPGTENPIVIPLDSELYYSHDPEVASGYIRPFTQVQETRSIS